jgi:hypothetical protein
MGKLLKGLHRLGLVELDEHVAQPSPESSGSPTDAAAQGTAQTAHIPVPDAIPPSDIVEGRPFEEIYQEYQVPPSPFPAEKLLKLLDGLRAMQPEMRRTAVTAMDSADDSWAIDDAVLDAMRKIKALEAAKQGLAQTAQAAVAGAQADLEDRERSHQEAVAQIRKQIADLEAMLTREIEGAAKDKADIQAAKRATEEAGLRERMRLDTHIQSLREVPDSFGADQAATTP